MEILDVIRYELALQHKLIVYVMSAMGKVGLPLPYGWTRT